VARAVRHGYLNAAGAVSMIGVVERRGTIVLPCATLGDDAPALVIVAQDAQTKIDERASGRALVNLLARASDVKPLRAHARARSQASWILRFVETGKAGDPSKYSPAVVDRLLASLAAALSQFPVRFVKHNHVLDAAV
jgi:hypothetical protein